MFKGIADSAWKRKDFSYFVIVENDDLKPPYKIAKILLNNIDPHRV